MPDNVVLRVNGEGLDRLKTVMKLAEWPYAVGYAVSGDCFVLFWTKHESMTAFPTRLTMDRCAEIAFDWLKEADYGKQPDHDGDNEKGWLCFTEAWGHVAPYGWQAFIAVKPCWMLYGK